MSHSAGMTGPGDSPSSDDSSPGDDASTGDSPDGSGRAARYVTDVSVEKRGNAIPADDVVSVTFGQVFADGDIAAGESVAAVIGDRMLPTQVDPKASWPDGSLRHGVITVRVPAPAGNRARTLKLYAVSHPIDSGFDDMAMGDLLATNFDARVEITRGGKVYRANAREALARFAQGRDCSAWGKPQCRQWLSGGLASEWIVSAPLMNGNHAESRLRVFFDVRAYRGKNGGIGNVRVDSIIENDRTYAVAPSDETYSARITVGDNEYAIQDLTQYTQTRWHKVLWTRSHPYFTGVSTAYLQRSRAVSKYADLQPSREFLESVPQTVRPMNHRDQTPDMQATGAQAAIGPLPRWSTTYVVSGDRRAFYWMLANDDAAGGYGFHYRDDETGRPVTIRDHPYITIADLNWARRAGGGYARDLLPACAGDCANPNRFDIAHHPSIGYVPYLVTGDFYYLEEMQFAASYVELWANPGYREQARGRLLRAYQQVRSQAWNLRTISDAAFATPDHDPLKSYFVDQINYIVRDYIASYVNDDGHPLHTLDAYGAVHYPANQGENVAMAPWQADFFTWAVGHAAEQGVPRAKKLLGWLVPFQIGLMTSSTQNPRDGFCWQVASGYTLRFRDDNDSPIYSSLKEVYHKTYPRLVGLKCGSQEMANALAANDDRVNAGQMVGYSPSPTGFPSNLQIALAVAADSDAAAAHKAWKVFKARANPPDYSNYPNFAVVPRSVY